MALDHKFQSPSPNKEKESSASPESHTRGGSETLKKPTPREVDSSPFR